MPVFIAMLIGGLVEAAGSLVGRAILALGVGAVMYTGLDLLISNVLAYSMASFTSVPGTIVGIMGLMQVDKVLSILSSAVGTAMTISGVRSGALTKWVHK